MLSNVWRHSWLMIGALVGLIVGVASAGLAEVTSTSAGDEESRCVVVDLNQLADDEVAGTQVPNNTTVTITPGFRTHLGANWYLLGGVEVPVTNPQPFDYQIFGALMKVW